MMLSVSWRLSLFVGLRVTGNRAVIVSVVVRVVRSLLR